MVFFRKCMAGRVCVWGGGGGRERAQGGKEANITQHAHAVEMTSMSI